MAHQLEPEERRQVSAGRRRVILGALADGEWRSTAEVARLVPFSPTTVSEELKAMRTVFQVESTPGVRGARLWRRKGVADAGG